MRIRSVLKTLCIALVATLVATQGCSKKSSVSTSISKSALISSLPTDTIGYFIWNTASSNYKKFKQSPWGKQSMPLSSSADSLTGLDNHRISSLISSLEKIGLFSADADSGAKPKEGILFISPNSSKLAGLHFGAYVAADSSSELDKKLAMLKSEVEAQGFPTKPFKEAGQNGFSFTIPASNRLYTDTVYASATSSLLTVASDKTLCLQPFSKDKNTTPLNLEQNQIYKDFLSEMTKRDDFVAGFLDTKKLLSSIEKFVPEHAPESQLLKEIPAAGLQYHRAFNETLSDTVTLAFDPKDKNTELMLKGIENSNSKTLLNASPSDSLISLQLDTGSLRKLKETLEGNLAADQLAALGSQLAIIDKLNRLAINLRSDSTESLFPEIMITAQTKEADKVYQELLNSLSLLQSSGVPVSGWNKTNIENTEVSFTLTPLGIGIYLAKLNGLVVLASSQSAIQKTIAATKNTQTSLYSTLSSAKAHSGMLKENIFSGYLDFASIASALETLQSTLAVFTGGAGNINSQELENLKQLGIVSFTGRRASDSISFNASYSLK